MIGATTAVRKKFLCRRPGVWRSSSEPAADEIAKIAVNAAEKVNMDITAGAWK
jgi:hypothetical protein